MADKVGKGPEGYQKGDDIMSGVGQGAMQGAQYGSALGVPGIIAGGLIGGISGGISGGKVTDADRAAYFARKEAERIQANPTQVAGFSPETQAKNVAAAQQAMDPKAYAAAMQNPAMARQYQADIQKMGQAAVGTQAQMVAKAQQAQRDQVLNLLNYAADTERAEAQQKAVEAQTRAYNAKANQMNQATAAQAFDFQDDMASIFNFGGGLTGGI